MATIPVTASRVVAVAAREIGTVEQRINCTAYGRAYGVDGVAWCAIFAWWVIREAGNRKQACNLRNAGFANPASCNQIAVDAKRLGWKRITPVHVRPGDLILWDFGVVSRGDPADDADHIGIASRPGTQVLLWCIEGNTGPGAGGSQHDGDGVFERARTARQTHSIWRPPYKPTVLRAELRTGARGGLVWDVQGLVGLWGRSGVDGIYGPATRRAVQDWQERHQIPRTGRFGAIEAAEARWRWRP